jgi:hypothetical protein
VETAPNESDDQGYGQPCGGQVLQSNGTDLVFATPTTTVNAQIGTAYTLASTDCGNYVTLNNGSAITVTMPNLSNGCRVILVQTGAGDITVVGTGGMVIGNSLSLYKSRALYSTITINQMTSTLSILTGDVN